MRGDINQHRTLLSTCNKPSLIGDGRVIALTSGLLKSRRAVHHGKRYNSTTEMEPVTRIKPDHNLSLGAMERGKKNNSA